MGGYGLRHPSVSVIVRACDAADGLTRSLNCLAAQTQRNLQVIVVEQGSDAAVARVLATAQDRDAMLECAHIDSDDPADAFDLGIERACGSYAYLMDAGDTLAPQTLERLFSLAMAHDLDLAMGSVGFAARELASDADEAVVYASDEEFHADAWRYFEAGILPYPGGKLFAKAHIDEAGARFASAAGTGFITSFLKDAHGVAFDARAICNVGEAALRQLSTGELARCWIDSDEQDLLEGLFASWGLQDDANTTSMLQRRYVSNVISTIITMCSPSCDLTEDEKRAHVERMITSDRTQQIASEAAPWSGAVRAMLMPIRKKDVSLAMGEGRIFSWLTRHNASLGAQLFS